MSRLDTGNLAVTDASGVATCFLRPSNAHQRWRITNTVVQTSPQNPTKVPECRVYVGSSIVDSTYSGNNDTSDTVIDVPAGSYLQVQWTKADPGLTCTVNVTGDVIQDR